MVDGGFGCREMFGELRIVMAVMKELDVGLLKEVFIVEGKSRVEKRNGVLLVCFRTCW